MGKQKAVVLLSGGLDSTVSAACAKADGYEVHALTINYGQRHAKELRCAKAVAEALRVKTHLIMRIDLTRIGGSALTDKRIAVQKTGLRRGIPDTYVPGRNIIFLSLAVSYAEKIRADRVYIGANSVDYSGYPDCRAPFVAAFENAAALGTKAGVEGRPIRIIAPLQNRTKGDIVKLAMKLKAPLRLTWSCYEGGRNACGKCDSCRLRLKGFRDAGAKDPIRYG